MAWTVGEVAKLAKVSVRTLHHYDSIGLLGPSARSEAGYRLYRMTDLERLQQVLFFKELGFGLDDIRRIMLDPAFDRREALRAQRALLSEKARRAKAMLAALDKAISADERGTAMKEDQMFDAFGDFDPKEYEDEVKERWGDTDAYRQSQQRMKSLTKDDIDRYKKDFSAVLAAFGDAMAEGKPIDSGEVQAIVERHRQSIEFWYTCSQEHHANLGRMYVADPRFKANYEKVREGLAQYVCDAIVYAAEHDA
jgi:MerR family transcriptional regulator, thiopeptide resistance regulator